MTFAAKAALALYITAAALAVFSLAEEIPDHVRQSSIEPGQEGTTRGGTVCILKTAAEKIAEAAQISREAARNATMKYIMANICGAVDLPIITEERIMRFIDFNGDAVELWAVIPNPAYVSGGQRFYMFLVPRQDPGA